MTRLERTLEIKILLTVVLWCLPLLFFPQQWFAYFGFPRPRPQIWIRLLGAAYLALVVCYQYGLTAFRRGGDPTPTVMVAIVSNGGAAAILTLFGLAGLWNDWGPLAQAYMWMSAAITWSLALAVWWFQGDRRA
jgi:hypothetical protein